jgi:hypothetical protein
MTAALIGFAILIALSFTGIPLAFATLLGGSTIDDDSGLSGRTA